MKNGLCHIANWNASQLLYRMHNDTFYGMRTQWNWDEKTETMKTEKKTTKKLLT